MESFDNSGRYEIDELLFAFSIFSLFISFYAYRRWKELKYILKKQGLDEAILKETNLSLEKKTKELEFHSKWNEKLGNFLRFLPVCKSKEELFKIIGQKATRLFGGTSGALFITKDSRNQLSKVAYWGDKGIAPDFIHPDECWGLRLGKRYSNSYNIDDPLCQHITAQNENQSYCIPLTAYGEIIGLLHILLNDGKDKDNNEVNSTIIENAVPLFAEQISLAISNLSLNDKLHDLAIHDPLTGLYNRQYLNEIMERELHRAKRNQAQFGVIMIDLDHFKKFNDSYGHAAGDLLLHEIGGLLHSYFRMEDFCCRFGGEEFLVLLPEMTVAGIKSRCEGLLHQISEINLVYEGQPLGKVTGSLGAALFPDNGEDSHKLLKAADNALYAAKKEGRNRVCLAST